MLWYIVGILTGIVLCLPFYFLKIKNVKSKSRQDKLTLLPDYQSFEKRFEEAFLRAKRYNTKLSLVLLDIDGFKSINDEFGYKTGDQLLKEFSHLLRTSLRQTDLLFRYKMGDEFAIILPENNKNDAERMCVRIKEILMEHIFIIENKEIKICFSAGICELKNTDNSISAFIEKTEIELRKEK